MGSPWSDISSNRHERDDDVLIARYSQGESIEPTHSVSTIYGMAVRIHAQILATFPTSVQEPETSVLPNFATKNLGEPETSSAMDAMFDAAAKQYKENKESLQRDGSTDVGIDGKGYFVVKILADEAQDGKARASEGVSNMLDVLFEIYPKVWIHPATSSPKMISSLSPITKETLDDVEDVLTYVYITDQRQLRSIKEREDVLFEEARDIYCTIVVEHPDATLQTVSNACAPRLLALNIRMWPKALQCLESSKLRAITGLPMQDCVNSNAIIPT